MYYSFSYIALVFMLIYSLFYFNEQNVRYDIEINDIETTYGLQYLLNHKIRNVALIVGTGESANMITSKNAYEIHDVADIWAMNQAFFHPYIIPRFYHLEMRAGTYGSNNDLWKFFDLSKRKLYTNTTFITTRRDKHSIAEMLTSNSPYPGCIITYQTTSKLNDKHGCTEYNIKKIHISQFVTTNMHVMEMCAASLTRIINIIFRLKYNKIAFIGVDLNNAAHFYTNYPVIVRSRNSYEKTVLRLDAKKYNSSIHATGARGVHLFLNKLAHYSNNVSFYNLAPTSTLSYMKYIHTINISSFLRIM